MLVWDVSNRGIYAIGALGGSKHKVRKGYRSEPFANLEAGFFDERQPNDYLYRGM